MKAALIRVRGIVQGVGFRPFCYRKAKELGLSGYVKNLGDASVEILVEGEKVEEFLFELQKAPPPARVEEILVKWVQPSNLVDFRIMESSSEHSGFCPPPPDLATCDTCLKEMLTPSDRRYFYPFITCMHCGPRFSILLSLPYDRHFTTMGEFPLCFTCAQEYQDPENRRFRAEPTCCPACGPKLRLFDKDGRCIEVKDPLAEAIRLLDEGYILAVKGIGGTHLATKTTEDEPIARLRELYRRPQQPFAVMSHDLQRVEEFAEIGETERGLLLSPARPIVLLKKREKFPLSELISPGLDTIGVMLTYSGIHYLLLSRGKDPAYVMTSANFSGFPMVIRNSEVFKLHADYFLLHNRKIANRCDDSVIRITDGKPTFIRRSRGYVPTPIKIRSEVKALGTGAELCLTFSISRDGQCFPSQHIGDLTKLEVLEYFREALRSWKKLLRVDKFELVACDLHPQLLSTLEAERIAEENGCKLVRVQHHFAHLGSLMAEYGLSEMVGIVADGVGYGIDGTIWGGEVLVIDEGKPRRMAGLALKPMPGGDLATLQPWRMVAGILWGVLSPHELKKVLMEYCGRTDREASAVIHQLERSVNTPLTSSCGRVLDAASSLLGICQERTYEGEPAMKLEAYAKTHAGSIKAESFVRGQTVDTSLLLQHLLDGLKKGVSRRELAAWAQLSLGKSLAELAVEVAKKEGITKIGVSGGVFLNDFMTRIVRQTVELDGIEFYTHRLLPPGDGGISVGQIYVATSLNNS